ncbi:MAG TPA: aminotransferase class V-fold PLP-dependent enzyme, partial [Methylocystis sp.]|nr:aminotransferase class V-fold PLP-dependent enzyme [Methylocystis sp.]
MSNVERALAALGSGPLREDDLRRYVDPLFSRSLRETAGRIYLSNHSLGRGLDQTAQDIAEGLGLWYAKPGETWEGWLAEMQAFRTRVAALIGAPGPSCIVPKASAGQGLRAVLNRTDRPIRVIATRSEFDSIDLILKAYAERGRIAMRWVASADGGRYRRDDFLPAFEAGAELLVLSAVFFDSGQWLTELGEIADLARTHGIEVLVDLYHAAG